MLSPSEFTVGKVGDAKPLSLILPTNKHEETILVGQTTAVFLSGLHKSLTFESDGNITWGGLIIPNTRIEVDEASAVDPYGADAPLLSAIRVDTKLAVLAKGEGQYESNVLVTLHNDLASAGEYQAAFTNWQVVIGDGQNKRIIWSTT